MYFMRVYRNWIQVMLKKYCSANILYYAFNLINILKYMRLPYSFCSAIAKSTQKIFALQLKNLIMAERHFF